MSVNNFIKQDRNELALVPKLYQESVFSRLSQSEFGVPYSTEGLQIVEFDPTTACNLGCPECISGSLLGAGGFSSDSVQSILQSFVELNVKAVVLIGGGEPMMHPDIKNIINFLYDHNIHIGITTNGLFIEKYLDIIAEKVSWIRVSVDASNEDTFRAVRPDKLGQSRFNELCRQMKLLGNHKLRSCKFGFSMLLLTRSECDSGEATFTNATEIYEAAKVAKSLGCDYFEVKPSFDANHYHIQQPSEIMQVAKTQLMKARNDLQSHDFKILTATNLFDIIECKPTQQPKEYTSCPVTNLRTLVSPSGVFPCPYFRGDITRSYGNPNHESLTDIWNGKQRKAITDNLNPKVDCKFHCIRHNTNLELFSLYKQSQDLSSSLSLLDDYNRFF